MSQNTISGRDSFFDVRTFWKITLNYTLCVIRFKFIGSTVFIENRPDERVRLITTFFIFELCFLPFIGSILKEYCGTDEDLCGTFVEPMNTFFTFFTFPLQFEADKNSFLHEFLSASNCKGNVKKVLAVLKFSQNWFANVYC